jgi:hypothetical protein
MVGLLSCKLQIEPPLVAREHEMTRLTKIIAGCVLVSSAVLMLLWGGEGGEVLSTARLESQTQAMKVSPSVPKQDSRKVVIIQTENGNVEVEVLESTNLEISLPTLKGQRSSEAPVSASPASMPTQSAAAYFAAESAKLDLLVRGSAAISAPSTAKVGDSFPASLRVSLKDLATVKQSLIDDFPENKTVVGKPNVKLTPRMEATLHGFGFEVSPAGLQQQGVSGNDATTWEWQVKATKDGVHTLTFTLFGSLTSDGEKVVHNVYHYRQKVQVPIEPIGLMGFLETHWEKLLGAIVVVVPAVCGLWALFRKPKNSEGARQLSLAQKLRERRRQRATGHP